MAFEGMTLEQLRGLTQGEIGVHDVPCPFCGPRCRAVSNQRRKVLRIWDDGAFLTFTCARCNEKGWAKDGSGASAPAERKPAEPAPPKPDRRALVQSLWARSQPALATPVHMYLTGRKCFVASPNIRYLPPVNGHAPSMISRFGTGELTGVHITRLSDDGQGKAGTDKDKIIIGSCVGQPIVVHDNPERGELIVTEGIEDAASLAIATGWTCWAAGAAGRIAPAITEARGFERVFIAVDDDHAGKRALAQAQIVMPVVPLLFSRAVKGADANKLIITYGAEALLAAVEWLDMKERFRQQEVSFSAMQTVANRLNALLDLERLSGVKRPPSL